MKVRLKRAMSRYQAREVADVSEETARRWIAQGDAVAADDAEVTPAKTVQDHPTRPVTLADIQRGPAAPAPEKVVATVTADTFQGEADEDPAPAEDEAVEQPPKAGPGSGKSAWAKYAADRGVTVADDATRDEIIAAVEAAETDEEVPDGS